MLRVLSTHLFLKQRLHPGLLELAARSGAQAVEIFAARQHFDYTSREHRAELASWFRSNQLEPFSMQCPSLPGPRDGPCRAPAVNVLHPEKARRIDAMDEIKRALETAEQIPFRTSSFTLANAMTGGRCAASNTLSLPLNTSAPSPTLWACACWLRTSATRPPPRASEDDL